MDPSIIRGDMVGYDGLVGVPPTPMYTPYGQPLTPYVFGRGHVGPISPRGFGLGASPINPSIRPRFPGPSPYGSQPYPMGFNPRVPGVPPVGFPRAPPPGFPPCYSQVFSVRGEHVNIPDGRGYRTGDGHISPDGLIIPGEPQNMILDEEVVSEESDQDPIPSEGDVGQGEPEKDPMAPGEDPVHTEDAEVPNGEGRDQAGIIPDERESIDPEEPEGDPAPEGTEGENPGNGEPQGQGQGGLLPDNDLIDPDDPRAEIEALRQQLAQAQAALAESAKALQKRTAQDIQVNKLRELVKKQRGHFDSKILELQTKEKEQSQTHLDKQKAWEEERRKEKAEWAERKRLWEEKSRKELQEKERVWKDEIEKQRLKWERIQQQERKTNKIDLENVKRELGDQVKQVLQAQQQQQQTANELLQENQRLMERVTQLADYNEELEEKVKRAAPAGRPNKGGANRMSTPLGSPNGSIVRTKVTASPVIEAHPLDPNSAQKFQFTKPGGAEIRGTTRTWGRNHPEPEDNLSDAGSEMSGGTIRRGIQIIKDHAPHNVYKPPGRGQSAGHGKGYQAAAANAVPTKVAGKGMDNFHGVNHNRGGYPGNQGRQSEGHYSHQGNPFDQASHAEGDVSIPSVYSNHGYDQFDDGAQGPEGNDYNQGAQESVGSHSSRGSQRRNGGQPPPPNQRNSGGQPPYQRGRGGNFGGYQPRANDRDNFRPFKDPKLTKYDGKIPWRAYEVKLMHMARKYDWDDNTKLAKLVEALDDKALTFFSNLAPEVQGNFEVVRRKMNNRFIPREPATTVRKQLQTIQQKPEEALEEWAERCQQCAYDAWGEMSEDVAELAAVEAFLGGVLETEAAFSVMEKDPHTIDEALELLKKAVHSRKSLNCRWRNTQRTARTVSFASEATTAEVRTTSVVNSPPQESKASTQKFEAELNDLRSSMTETQGQVAKILELLTAQKVQRGRARSRSPSPSPDGPCYRCGERGHIARNCPNRSRSPSPAPRRESSTNQENQ